TSAHELGHAVLHPAGGGIHRDRPVDGAAPARDRTEREADRFATYFLMPEKLVRARFSMIFGESSLALSEETAFALGETSLLDLTEKYRARRRLARLLASTDHYNGRYFKPLAEQFRV